MKLMIVVGARPNFMKAAPIVRAVAEYNAKANQDLQIVPILIHTGQHYDEAMSDAFFQDLGLPTPDAFLGVGSGSHAAQTAEIIKRFETVLLENCPDVVVVVGDVNSTVACALVTAKVTGMECTGRPVLAHVEAGLRSFDREMPEELNRVVTDQLSDLLFVTEESAIKNLANEGIPKQKIFFVGNTMIDSLLSCEPIAERSSILQRLGLTPLPTNGERGITPYILLTLHRPANVDSRPSFVEILEGLSEIAGLFPIIFPAHPRTRHQIERHGLSSYFAETDRPELYKSSGITLTDPQGYIDFLCLMKNATLVVTDSGGIQEETTCLGVPCVTVRNNTERPVTLQFGSNRLGGTHRHDIRTAIRSQLRMQRKRNMPKYWDGKAARRIVEILLQHHHNPRLREASLASSN